MALVKFKLHHKHKNGTRQIRIYFYCENGVPYVESTKETVREDAWDAKRQRVKPSFRKAGIINQSLDDQQTRLETIIRQLRAIPQRVTPEAIRARLRGETKDFWTFFEWLIENPPADWGPATLKSYKKQRALFRRFEKKNYGITFAGINQQFADDLTNFMRTESYGVEKKSGEKLYYNDSTIKNTFRRISGITTYAVKYGVIKGKEKISSPAKAMDSGAVYLNDAEIQKIYKRLKKPIVGEGIAGDINLYGKIFVLGTQLGLRVSDMKIGPENFIDGKKKLSVSNKKTVSEVIIPLSKLATEIFEEFDWRIPAFSEVLMNRYIKIICEIAKINDVTIHRSVVGGKMVEEKFYKYEKITSHTMRRSFATNMYLAGIKDSIIMRITGHRSTESFMRYIRVSNQEAAEIMAKHLGM